MQSFLWSGAAGALAVAALASWADRRRNNRRDLDKVGLVPWPLVLVLAILAAAVCAGLALRAG